MIPEVAEGRKIGTFGNFGGDCPVQENGRKGHSFYYEYRRIMSLRQYADAVLGLAVSVCMPRSRCPDGGLLDSGFILSLCETPGTV